MTVATISKQKVYERIEACGIVAVVRAESPEQALSVAEAVRRGGIDVIEITFTVPGALQVIEKLVAAYPGKEVLVGAGTVLDGETARLAILAGADFVVSPALNVEMVRVCNRYQKLSMPGAMSIKEVIEAMEAGGDMIKVFPGSVLGVEFVKAARGPLPQARFVPTGGVSLDNVEQWIKAGCVAVGVGTELTRGAATGDFDQVTATAREFVARIEAARRG